MRKLLFIGFILSLLSTSVFAFNQADLNRLLAGDKNMVGADLSGASIYLAVIPGGKFKNVNFKNANFKNAYLNGFLAEYCDFANANFKGANLIRARFSYSNFYGTNFSNANLESVGFIFSTIKKTNFTNANLKLIDMLGGNIDTILFQDVNFQNADLTRAMFRNGTLTTEKFTGAKFNHTHFQELKIPGSSESFFKSKSIDMHLVKWIHGTIKNNRVKKITPHTPKAVQHNSIKRF